jgi:oligopeptide/dipeptide ABC transporter ATP-binding protein
MDNCIINKDAIGNRDFLLEVFELKKWFPIKEGFFSRKGKYIKAVDGVSFSIRKGDTLGLVGESGCGKSTVGRSILRLIEPSGGKVYYEGADLTKLNDHELREARKNVQIVFQDPYSSLNPRMTVGDIVCEPYLIHGITNRKSAYNQAKKLLEMVGIDAECMRRFPHEFSGGQRQRISIARVLAVSPSLIICDESVSALDVSIQAQILNLLLKLQRELHLTYLFISHNLSVVKHVSTHVGVMYLGKLVEKAPKDELFDNPRHPYTKVLLSAVPVPDPTSKSQRIILKGDVPSPINTPSGCPFHPRCPEVSSICSECAPPQKQVGEGHWYSCHH